MFTKNFYYCIPQSVLGYKDMGYTQGNSDLKNVLGDFPDLIIPDLRYWITFADENNGNLYPSMHYARNSYDDYGGVVFGNGNVAPTLEDYCLAGDVFKTFNYVAEVKVLPDKSGVTITGVYTLTNTGSEAFTISEVGLIGATGDRSYDSRKCLIERTLLDTPVTIPAGGFGQVTYTIRFDYPF